MAMPPVLGSTLSPNFTGCVIFVLQLIIGERLNVQPGSFRGHLDLAGHQADHVLQRLGDNQPACLVDG